MDTYDWSERLVRQLVYSNHVPTEGFAVAADGRGYGTVVCDVCHQSWPCATLKSLREWVANGGYDDAPRTCGYSHKCSRCGYMIGWSEREQK